MEDTKELTNKYIMNTYNRFDIEITHGNSVYVYDNNNKQYLDFASGIAVNSIGYTDTDFIASVTIQLNKLNHISNLFYSRPQAEVAKILVNHSCFEKVFFCNSGAEANEAMIKIARKFGKTKSEKCTKIISMEKSFHGRTMGTITLTGQEKYQKPFIPILQGVEYAKFNDIESAKSLIDENVCAVIVEPVQGEGGLYPAKLEFLQGLRKLCDENNILLGFDEVQCGVGRLGKLFAYQTYGVEPDMVSLAKGLAGGLPIGACVAKGIASNILTPGDHASTFGGNPVSCSGAKVVLSKLLESGILDNVENVGSYLKNKLVELSKKYSIVKDVRGIGLMLGVEFTIPVREIMNKCIERGLLLIGAGQNVIRFVPPLVISNDNVDAAIDIIDGVLKEIK